MQTAQDDTERLFTGLSDSTSPLSKLIVYTTERALRSASTAGFVYRTALDHLAVVIREYKSASNLTIYVPRLDSSKAYEAWSVTLPAGV